MNKIYKAVTLKRTGNLSGFISKHILLLLFGFMGLAGSVKAQVNIGATPYTTLKAAFDAINAGTHTGAITINIASPGTTETAMAVLNSSGTGAASYTSVLIKPTGAATITGALATALVKLNGSDFVTIDGAVAGTTPSLTFTNTSGGTSSAGIWIASASVSDGATNNTIKNCIVTGFGNTSTFAGIVTSSAANIQNPADVANTDNTIQNNVVSSSFNGIVSVGNATTNDSRTIIRDNNVNTIGFRGIDVFYQATLTISGNTITGVHSATSGFGNSNSGIHVAGNIAGGNIFNNKINDINKVSVWGCNGIQLDASTTNSNLTIYNNFIWDVTAGGFNGAGIDDNGFGIAVNTGGGYNIYYNSVDLSLNQPTSSGITAAMWISSSISTAATLNIRDNIFSNRQTNSTRYAIYCTTGNTVFSNINYNDYYSTGASLGFLGSARNTLANWQSATGGDLNSSAIDPSFNSTADLHLNPATSMLDGLGTPIAGITTDIDLGARNVTTPDMGADEFTANPCPGSNAGTAVAGVYSICGSGSTTLTSSGFSFGAGITYQWQISNDNFSSNVVDLAGQTSALSGNTGVIAATRWFRLKVTCSFTASTGYSNVIQIDVNNPQVTGTGGGTRCGTGTVNLTATGTGLQWYAAVTGGTAIGSGSPFTTPVISATTPFYVSASAIGAPQNGGKSSTNGSDGTNGTGGIFFTATETFTLNTVVMYPTNPGTNTIVLYSGSTTTGTPIFTTNYTFAGANPSGEIVPLGWVIPPGTYTIYQSASAAPCWRDISGGASSPSTVYPYTIGTSCTLTDGSLAGYYYFFYDWNITSSCEGTRTAVTATVTAPPAITVTPVSVTQCGSTSPVNISVSSSNAGYTYSWNPGGMIGPGPHSVNPAVTTVYTVTATDISGGANNGCATTGTSTININQVPTALSISPASGTVCGGTMQTLLTNGGTLPNQTVFAETFETFPLTQFALGGTGTTLSQNTTYFSQGAASARLLGSTTTNTGWIAQTADMSLVNFTSPILSFDHICGSEAGFDYGYIEYSVNSGSSYTILPATSYTGSGTLHTEAINAGTIGFDRTSYPDWSAQFSSAASTPGTGPATSLWKHETIDLTPWQGTATFRLRFRLRSDVSIQYYGWLIDNIRVSATGQTAITWTGVPGITELYLNTPPLTNCSSVGTTVTCTSTTGLAFGTKVLVTAGTGSFVGGTTVASILNGTQFTVSSIPSVALVAATVQPLIPYTAGVNAGTVITVPTVGVTYTATATGAGGCTTTANSVLAVSGATITNSIAVTGGSNPSCNGNAITFTATGVNGGTLPYYRWEVNGVVQNPLISVNPFTISTLVSGDQVRCFLVSNVGACASPNPAPSNIITVTINPKPTGTAIAGSNFVCIGASTVLTASSTGGTTYQWFLGGVSQGAASASTTFNATLPGSYTVVSFTGLGCSDTSIAKVLAYSTVNITASSGPNGTISPSGTVTVNCGANQTFTFTPNPGYSICAGTGVLIDGVPNLGAIAAGNYTFTNITVPHTISVTFCIVGCATPPTANAGANNSFCANTTYTLSGSIGGSASIGTWTGGTGTYNPNNTTLNAIYTPSAAEILAGTVTLTLSTDDPDGGGPCIASTSNVTLTIKSIPTLSITGTAGFCPSGSTTLTANSTISPVGPITYAWLFNGITPLGAASTQVSSSGAGTYQVTVTGNGCSNVASVPVVAFVAPTVSISGSSVFCTRSTTDLSANAVAGSGTIPVNGFQWKIGGVNIVGATSATYTANTAGNYTVLVTNSNGCSTLSAAFALGPDTSPLNGAYTIGIGAPSCTNYESFAIAINDLNTRGISGPVRFDVISNYIETSPDGGFFLGSTLLNGNTALGRTISFQKTGAGSNPLLKAYTGTHTPADATPDGIFILRGVDNVTIDHIDLVDPNGVEPNTMEFGYGLFKFATNDGAQNNTITDCNITLNRVSTVAPAAPMVEGSVGILVINAKDSAATTALSPTLASGGNSNNKFYSNIITNCNHGIALSGFAATSPFTTGDNGNDVGGASSATGNTILNYGGGGTLNAAAIRANNQWSLNISNNIMNNNDGGGFNHNGIIRGIYGQAGTSATVTISNNTITLNGGGTTSAITAIDNAIGATPAANTVTISNNTMTGTYSTVTSGSWNGIVNSANPATLSISGNVVQNVSYTGATAGFTGISNTGAASTVSITSNTVQNCQFTGTGTLLAISNSAATPSLTISSNTIKSISKAVTGSGLVFSWIVTGSPTTATVNSNIITDNKITGAAATTSLQIFGIAPGVIPTFTCTGNSIQRDSVTSVTIPTILAGYSSSVTALSTISTTETITNNTIRRLFISGTNAQNNILGINAGRAGAVTVTRTISGNIIDSLYTASGTNSQITGIFNGITTGTASVFKNKIHSLFPGATAATGLAKGISSSATTANISNNMVDLDLTLAFAPAANGVLTGSDVLKGLEVTAGTTVSLYYNTIRLAGAGTGTAFGSSAIGVTSATANVDMRNNILVNLTTPGGVSPGFAVAYRRSAAVTAAYVSTSNNNDFYSGTASASNLLYFDGTSGYQTMATYIAGASIAPREAYSISTLPVFVNVAGPIDLHLATGNNCELDGGGAPIGGYTDDIDAVSIRDASAPDIGADEFDGTGGSGNWKGVNTNWLDPKNWCGVVPTIATNVVIPAGKINYPLITVATPVCNNITINTGGSVFITGVGKLGINGAISTSGTFNVVDGTIEMQGASPQTIPAAAFVTNDLKNLVINNASVTLGGALNLYGKLSFTGSNRTFATANNLTLRSTATGTASVADITNNSLNSGNTITGNVSVERFISARRAWRFLSVATQNSSQTIHQAWQENQPANNNLLTTYGTQITSNIAGWAAAGFDLQSSGGPSVKTYVPASSTWAGIPNTSSTFTTGVGYMTFIRGDRTQNSYPGVANTTILREKDPLVTGSFAAAAIGAGLFGAIGNPYASAVDFSKLTKTNLQDVYYMWDPKLGTLGAYQTFAGPTYSPVPGGGSYSGANINIESGQAFFVHSSGLAGSLTFTEPSKATGSNLVARPFNLGKQLRNNIYVVASGESTLFDGVLNQFGSDYSNKVDDMDAMKLGNFSENLGILRENKILSVERRSEDIMEADTIFYTLGQLRIQNYEFELMAENLAKPGLEAFLEDSYMHSRTALNLSGTTKYDFNIINDPGSYASDRFRVVFKQARIIPPVKFVSIDASKQLNNIIVDWKMANELNMHHYEIEKSANGIDHFSKLAEKAANGNGTVSSQYNWLDTNPWSGDNFYRVRSVGMNGEILYSAVVKVDMGKIIPGISVFPNPLQDDKLLNVSMNSKPAGIYQLSLINADGKQVMNTAVNHSGGNNVYNIAMSSVRTHGNYLLTITGEDNIKLTFKIVY